VKSLLVELIMMNSILLCLVLMLAMSNALTSLVADNNNVTLPTATRTSRRHVHATARRNCHRQVCYL